MTKIITLLSRNNVCKSMYFDHKQLIRIDAMASSSPSCSSDSESEDTASDVLHSALGNVAASKLQNVCVSQCGNVHVGDIIQINAPIELKTVVQVANVTAQITKNKTTTYMVDSSTSDIVDFGIVHQSGRSCFVTRSAWQALPPVATEPLDDQLPYVVICHTATEWCPEFQQNVLQMQYIQDMHMRQRGWWDIGYNFLIGGDGNIYEGRGWDVVGSYAQGYNRKCIGIAFVGTFVNKEPNRHQIMAALNLMSLAAGRGKLAKDYKILGHCQISATQSPGDALFNSMKKWPHWAAAP